MIAIYGIKNCDTVKKSIDWFKARNLPFEFHDYKSKGISEEKLEAWIKETGWESLVNKKGTTWKKLDDLVKEKITSDGEAMKLMKAQTSVIKRPVIEVDGRVEMVGFDAEKYEGAFGSVR